MARSIPTRYKSSEACKSLPFNDNIVCLILSHIVTLRLPEVKGYREGVKSQKFSFENIKGEFIGFYSEHHQGIFTHTDGFVYIHFLMKYKSFMSTWIG
ncbi:acetolactate decarboxylase [Flagellimonas ruestringensis]|uniref:acetolactate decarboxylase n=1 Tax=Flagellimonas ruestringensis TaxID=111501 RepID=UPI0002DCC5CA|nr:acetolactate decarboxylase [Allomuricauda ruestringensis]